MINEKARLEYLARMGVKSFVPREQLPGAKPSPRLIPTDGKAPKEEVAAQGLDDVKNALAGLAASLNTTKAKKEPAHTPEPHQAEVTIEQPTEIEATTEPSELNFTLFQHGDVCIACDTPTVDGLTAVQHPHRVLIGDAFRILCGHIDNRRMQESEFIWPPAGQPQLAMVGGSLSALEACIRETKAKLTLLLSNQSELRSFQGFSEFEIFPNLQNLLEDGAVRQSVANRLAAIAADLSNND